MIGSFAFAANAGNRSVASSNLVIQIENGQPRNSNLEIANSFHNTIGPLQCMARCQVCLHPWIAACVAAIQKNRLKLQALGIRMDEDGMQLQYQWWIAARAITLAFT